MKLYTLRVMTIEDITIERKSWDEATEKAQEMEREFRTRTHHGEQVTVDIIRERLPA